jgi:hypothetical protein
MSNTTTKIMLEREGEKREAYLVSETELQKLKEQFEAVGADINACNCGDEKCVGGYIYSCAEDSSGNCRWYKSDWQCNS